MRTLTPYRANSAAAVRPTGPAPTIKICGMHFPLSTLHSRHHSYSQSHTELPREVLTLPADREGPAEKGAPLLMVRGPRLSWVNRARSTPDLARVAPHRGQQHG
jgi:hypothetical protein